MLLINIDVAIFILRNNASSKIHWQMKITPTNILVNTPPESLQLHTHMEWFQTDPSTVYFIYLFIFCSN